MKLFKVLFLASLAFIAVQDMSDHSSTPTPSPTVTSSHVPADSEYFAVIRDLILENETCDLPCFMGLQPGQTTLEEVEVFSQEYFDRALISGHVTTPAGRTYRSLMLDLPPSNTGYAIVMDFTFDNEILTRMEVHLYGLDEWLPEHSFNPSTLLNELVSLPQIDIGVNVSTGSIALVIVDEENGIMARYGLNLRGRGNTVSPNLDTPLLLCPTSGFDNSVTLWLQDANNDEPLESLISNSTLPNDSLSFYQSVYWMTGLHTEQFVEQIISNPEDCIEMLSYPELLQRGYEF
jgi:hypothetical protein